MKKWINMTFQLCFVSALQLFGFLFELFNDCFLNSQEIIWFLDFQINKWNYKNYIHIYYLKNPSNREIRDSSDECLQNWSNKS